MADDLDSLLDAALTETSSGWGDPSKVTSKPAASAGDADEMYDDANAGADDFDL